MKSEIEVFRSFIRNKGLRNTPEREQVIKAIFSIHDHFDVDELYLRLRKETDKISKATIYRTVKLLQDAGIITQALFDSKQAHYRLIYGREPHDHMLCMRSGKLIEFSSPELTKLRDNICRELGWEPVGHRFQIYAISPDDSAPDETSETTD